MKHFINICIIPAKGHSERLPRKNIRELAGKPLLGYTIECALTSGLFDDICVSTEDQEVANIAVKFGARIPYTRPEYLTKNDKGVADVCIDLLKYLEREEGKRFKNTFILLPTSPFRRPEYLREAYDRFNSRPDAKVLMSMVETSYPPFWAIVEAENGLYRRMFPPEESNRRRHDLKKTYRPDGMIKILSTEAFIKRGDYNFPEIMMYETPGYGSIDIDEPIDFEFAEFLIETGKIEL